MGTDFQEKYNQFPFGESATGIDGKKSCKKRKNENLLVEILVALLDLVDLLDVVHKLFAVVGPRDL